MFGEVAVAGEGVKSVVSDGIKLSNSSKISSLKIQFIISKATSIKFESVLEREEILNSILYQFT